MLTLVEWRSSWSDRNGTNGSWKCRTSNRSSVQHLLDQLAVAMRDGERADRPVGGHAEAVAQADDVALARALRAVGAADDADVVAARHEVLVEVLDVGVDAARQRVDVRRDEADLHVRLRRPGRRHPDRTRRAAPPAGIAKVTTGAARAAACRRPRRASARGVLAELAAGTCRAAPATGRRSPSQLVVRATIAARSVVRRRCRGRWSRPGPRRWRGGRRCRRPRPRRCSATNAGTRRVQRMPAVVGLNASIASGWKRGSACVQQPRGWSRAEAHSG